MLARGVAVGGLLGPAAAVTAVAVPAAAAIASAAVPQQRAWEATGQCYSVLKGANALGQLGVPSLDELGPDVLVPATKLPLIPHPAG